MPTTTNRAYEVPAHGTEIDTWDVPLNDNFDAIDQNLGAVSSISLTNVNVTLSAAQYACGTISFSGTLTGNVIITFPSVSGWWVVENLCTGNFYVQLTCGAGNRVCSPPGEAVDILTNGTDVKYRNLGRVGSFLDIYKTSIPSWISNCTIPPYLYCDGSSFSAVTYPALNAFLGGTTLPDFKGRLPGFYNDGTSRMTSTGGVDGNTLGASGGAQTITIAQVNLPVVNLSAASLTGSVSTTINNGSNVVRNLNSSDFGTFSAGTGAHDVFDSISASSSTLALNSGTVTFGGNVPLGGSGTAKATLNPICIGGIRLIRAA